MWIKGHEFWISGIKKVVLSDFQWCALESKIYSIGKKYFPLEIVLLKTNDSQFWKTA